MTSLVALDACLAQALSALTPVRAERIGLRQDSQGILAEDLVFPADLPASAQALRSGHAVASLDLMGASAQMPTAFAAHPLHPGQALPPGCDAILPADDIDLALPVPQALRAPQPGEGTRLAGHDARKGQIIAPAGSRLTGKVVWLARMAGIDHALVRRPRVAIALPPSPLADLILRWTMALGAEIVSGHPDLILRPAVADTPRLALMPGETGWLGRGDDGLTLDLPLRFDGALSVFLALGLPAMQALSQAPARTLQANLSRKLVSAIGLSELCLLTPADTGWTPEAPGTVTLAGLARARAFVVVSPQSEGYPAGATVTAYPLDPDADLA